MHKVEYIHFLTNEDKVRVKFSKNRGNIVKFVVQYYSLISSRWHTILRIDNCHDYPHQHTYHLKKKQFIILLHGDNNKVFTEYLTHIKKNFRSIKENYLFSK